ncbi:MAG TPA: right-handed parallel beta-helix repeat-containing protein [Thermoanaerobaculia bacterium]|nr:right-handed parallel beta-helix repeat-containing protein [Thermoanaerobaculia bacterium]
MKRSFLLSTLAVLTLLVAVTVPAYAQATRTWVSGVGDDANPCSRTAPCKTFAGAISKTAPSGEINVLDPGGFGAVTITKSITISSEGFEAGVLVSGTNGIIVNVPNATDVVVLRGLDIEGLGTGLSGVTVLTGGTVYVEKCTINHFTTSGINFTPSVAGSQLTVTDSIIRNNGGTTGQAVLINATAAVKGNFDNVRIENNNSGLRVLNAGAVVSVKNSVAAANTNAGFATGSGSLTLEHSAATGNGTGVVCGGGAVRMGNNNITLNGTQVSVVVAGTCFAFKNNDIDPPAAGLTQLTPQ